MAFMNPYSVVTEFEEVVAKFAGSRYAVAVESCTSALFLSLMYLEIKGQFVSIPKYTYPGVPCSIIHAGGKVHFIDEEWKGAYQLYPFKVVDAALRFRKGMYEDGSLYCLSFHIKKLIPIGRGGMILLDDKIAYEWLKKARFDGRSPVPLKEDNFTMLGWNCYMQPEQAARGLQLFQTFTAKYPEGMDLDVDSQGYPDLSKFEIYKT
jgi:dTDP-4-amino-4,6-dideoxygalactose transaminase